MTTAGIVALVFVWLLFVVLCPVRKKEPTEREKEIARLKKELAALEGEK